MQALLEDQHADLASLPLRELGEGWDNVLFHLGDDLVVRVPRRAASAALTAHEQRWLPVLAPRLPLPIPVPVRVGTPGCGFPWPWSIVRWFQGHSALAEPPADPIAAATILGRFVASLHQPAPDEAPHNPWRGVPLEARVKPLRQHLERVTGEVNTTAVMRVWETAIAAPPWAGPPVWIHGDLHPGNLLVNEGRLCAVIDFGDLTAGDPATDLSIAWMMLPAWARPAFFAAAGGDRGPIDDATVARARGWALALGLAYLANSADDAGLAAVARGTIAAVLAEDA